MSKVETMIKMAREAMKHAYAPYSKYYVGACVEAEEGSMFAGCNVENASYGITICAEVNAISSLISAGKKRIKSVLVMSSGGDLATPCGRCRQFIREFAAPDVPIHLCVKDKVYETVTLEQLLPKSFGPDHLTK